MVVEVAGMLVLGAFLAALVAGVRSGLIAACALTAFGATAVIGLPSIGGLNILAAHGALALFCAFIVLRGLLAFPRAHIPRAELEVGVMFLIALWGIVSAFVMPRLFEGEILVNPYAKVEGGIRLSTLFPTQLIELHPSNGNLSQPAYLLLSALILYIAVYVGRRYGAGVLEKGIAAAAVANAGLGGLDLIGLDGVVDFFHTASYAYLTSNRIYGMERIVGGFSEASAFAGFSGVLFAYSASRLLDAPTWSWGALAAVNGLMTVVALSSTGLGMFAAILALLFLRLLVDVVRGRGDASAILMTLFVTAAAGILVLGVLMLTSLGDAAWKFVEVLILDKADSVSGMEREAWAREGIRVGLETHWLGVGLGSMRANGLVSVWFANLGAPGLLMLAMLIGLVMTVPSWAFESQDARGRFRAAYAALAAMLVGSLTSATVVDPGPLFMILAAIAVTSRPTRRTLARMRVVRRRRRPIELPARGLAGIPWSQ